MKLRKFLFAGFAGVALSLSAQTHTQGIEYYKADQLNNAFELLNRNMNNPGTDKALTYYYLGLIDMRQGKLNEAEKNFQAGLNADANNPYNYVGMGYLTLKRGDLKEAEKYFKEAEKKSKKDVSVMVDIARSYYDVNPVTYKNKYEKILKDAKKKDLQNPDIYILEGDIFRDEAYAQSDSKIYGKAAASYDSAKIYDPTSSVAYVKYADMYTNAKNPRQAITELESLMKTNPNSALGQRQLANLYYSVGEYSKAADAYGRYVKNPDHFKEDEDQYSFLLFYDEKYKDGYDYATELLAKNPDNYTAQRYQFMNAAQLENMADQMLPLAEALWAKHQSNPKKYGFAPIDYNLISNIFKNNQMQPEALAVLNEGIEANPSYTNYIKTMANIYGELNDYEKATAAINNYIAKSQNPTFADYFYGTVYPYNYAVTLRDAGDQPQADEYFKMAKKAALKALEMQEDTNLQNIVDSLQQYDVQ